METAIVLSGGGARGDFQVGALRYLYGTRRYPRIVCGSSVGAINGVKLAEGGAYSDEAVACYVYDKPSGATGELFQLFHPVTGDHLYTMSGTERQSAIDSLGYLDDGIACYVFPAATGVTGELFQLFNPVTGDHFYTMSGAERQGAIDDFGYVDEGIACYVHATQAPGTSPLYRLLHKSNGDHFYTVSAIERDAALFDAGLDGLERIWLDLESDADMYVEMPWFTRIQNSEVKRFLRQALADSTGMVAGAMARYALFAPWMLYDAIRAGIDLSELGDAIAAGLSSKSVYSLSPIESKLRDPAKLSPQKVRSSGIRLRLAVVGLESGALRYITESGQLLMPAAVGDHLYTTSKLERDEAIASSRYRLEEIACYVHEAPCGNTGELFHLAHPVTGDHLYTMSGAERQDAIDNLKYVDRGVACYVYPAATGATGELFSLRHFATGSHLYTMSGAERQGAIDDFGYVDDGIACYVHATQAPGTSPLYRLVEITDAVDVDLVNAVLASAAIPVLFEPVKLSNEWYADGGVRDILPVQAAVDLGAEEILAIAASAAPGAADSFDTATLETMGLRAVELMTGEILHNESNPPRGWDVPITVIQPTVDVHTIMTITQGTVSISMGYGFMRAADVLGVPEDQRQRCSTLSDSITSARKAIMAAETFARTSNVLSSQQARDELLEVRRMKRELRAMVGERQRLGGAGCVPADVETWWLQWERRPDPPFLATPWVAVVDNGNELVAADAP